MILNSPTISGSLTVTGNIITSGSITISGSIASASYATNAELLDGLDSTAFATTGAYSATSASLYATSASLSATSGSLSATSGSLSATSGSLSATSGSLSTASGSFNTRVTALEVTGSALSSSLLTVSGSGYATSGSLSTASGSFDSRVATIESKYATTGSNTFTSTQVVSGSILQSGSFTTTGTIIAQTINVQTVTSSVVYSSGSNVFGNSIGNSQVFTGSVLITGSLTIAGNITSNGNAAVLGSGSTCYLPKFTGASTIGNSLVYDNGTNVGINTATPNDYIDGESGMAILRATNGRAVLSLVGTRTDAGETLGRISFTNTNSTNAGSKRLAYISGTRGTTNNSAYLEFAVANDTLGAVAMTLSQTGNLGLGVTPSAWESGYSVLQQNTKYFNAADGSANYQGINAYYNAGWKYIASGTAQYLQQYNGGFTFFNAASGTAGAAITWATLLTIASTGAATFSNSFTTSDTAALFLSPSLSANNTTFLQLGKNIADTYNSGEMSFKYVGSGSTSNMVSLGFYGAGNKLNVLGNGNVGIGTSSPSGIFQAGVSNSGIYFDVTTQYTPKIIAAGTISDLQIESVGSGGNMILGAPGATSIMQFFVNGTLGTGERMRITSGGNVGIGTSSPFSNHRATFTNTSVGTDRSTIYLQGIYSGTNPTAGIDFGSTNGTAVAAIRQVMTNTGNGESNIVFHTWNGSSLLERLTITSGGEIQSSGDLKFNSANTVYNASGDFYVRASTHLRLGAGGTNSLMTVFNNGNVSINTSDIGYKLNLNGQPGANGYTAWTNYSDSRLKENVTDFDATNVLDKINRIRPVTYNYNELSGFDEATRERRISGFIAQELMEVFPDMVGTIKKEDTEYYDTNLSNLNLYLVKAIQELKAENDIFKTCLGIL